MYRCMSIRLVWWAIGLIMMSLCMFLDENTADPRHSVLPKVAALCLRLDSESYSQDRVVA